jgi:hypothetical protein
MAAPSPVEPTTWFALFLTAGALLILVTLAAILKADKVHWLAPPRADVTDPRPADHRANGAIQILVGLAAVGAVGGVAFGIAGLLARRKDPSPRNVTIAAAAIALGIIALPLTAMVWVWGHIASSPWSFG